MRIYTPSRSLLNPRLNLGLSLNWRIEDDELRKGILSRLYISHNADRMVVRLPLERQLVLVSLQTQT
jgi:hypothetical protein